MSQDRRTSDIWKHFSKVNSSLAKCDICKKNYSYKTSLSNLKKHLKNAHFIYLYTETDTLQVTFTLNNFNFKFACNLNTQKVVEVFFFKFV